MLAEPMNWQLTSNILYRGAGGWNELLAELGTSIGVRPKHAHQHHCVYHPNHFQVPLGF